MLIATSLSILGISEIKFIILSFERVSKTISYETDKLSKKSQLSVNCNFILH